MPMLPKRSCIEPGCSAVAAAGSSSAQCMRAPRSKPPSRFYDDQRGTTLSADTTATIAACG